MLAEAFASVDFPILPFIQRQKDGKLRLLKRNARLFTPRDFDYSPYFDIIKYPYMGFGELTTYRQLPWHKELVCNEEDDCFRHEGQGDSDKVPPATRVAQAPVGANHRLQRLRSRFAALTTVEDKT